MSGRSGQHRDELTRVTVQLIPKAASELEALMRRTGLSKTDLMNRACTLYDWVDGRLRAGDELLVRHPDGQVERVIIKLCLLCLPCTSPVPAHPSRMGGAGYFNRGSIILVKVLTHRTRERLGGAAMLKIIKIRTDVRIFIAQ